MRGGPEPVTNPTVHDTEEPAGERAGRQRPSDTGNAGEGGDYGEDPVPRNNASGRMSASPIDAAGPLAAGAYGSMVKSAAQTCWPQTITRRPASPPAGTRDTPRGRSS